MSEDAFIHALTVILAAAPATIAAISSLKNGREQRRVREELEKLPEKVVSTSSRKRLSKKPEDWYEPPNFE